MTSVLITRNILARQYVVYVPESDVEAFREARLPGFDIRSDAEFDHIRNYLAGSGCPPHRIGWYFQQFVKISAILKGHDDDTNLIWDADTAPIVPLNFTDPCVCYYQSNEYHRPYFTLIERVFGYTKAAKPSFVCQCLPSKVAWTRRFAEDIQNAHGTEWYKAIIDRIDFRESSGFSEYETLGTYIFRNFREDIRFSTQRWLRKGNSKAGGLAGLDANLDTLAQRYDYISFESWDPVTDRSGDEVRTRLKSWLSHALR